jgi:hypothetical protein
VADQGVDIVTLALKVSNDGVKVGLVVVPVGVAHMSLTVAIAAVSDDEIREGSKEYG